MYDALIEGIPADCVADEIVCGPYHAYVRSGEGHGFGAVLTGDTRHVMLTTKPVGMPLKKLAEAIKSWNYVEAGIGNAAINAYYNSVTVARKNGVNISSSRFTEDRVNDPFITYQKLVRNKKVGVIEHFPYIDNLFAPVCDLSVLARWPQEDEYPYTAAEYILPECDYVFIACGSLIDKSLPRFLELSKQAYVVLVGPCTPLAPVLSQYGVKDLSGYVIKDGERARCICGGQANYSIYSSGQKVSLRFNGEPNMV